MRLLWRGACLALLAFLLATAAARPAAAFEPTFDDECLTDGFAKDKMVRNGAVVVHYKGKKNRAAAKRVARLAGGTIHPKFKKLLGRVPPSDRKEGCYRGPNGKYDIFITKTKKLRHIEIPNGTLAFVHPYDPWVECDPKHPTFAIVRPDVRKAVLAHELFHAFSAAYKTAGKCGTYKEWEEGLATWGGNYVYPHDNIEHAKKDAMTKPEWGIDFWDYPSWVFPYYVTQKFGAKSVRAMLEAKEKYKWDVFMDKAIPGGFAQRLPEFAVYAYNQAPLPNVPGIGASFAQWDGFTEKPSSVPLMNLRLGGAHTRTDPIAVPKAIMDLGREYRRVVVGDTSIRQLTFLNASAGNPDFHVRALVKRADGSWRSENWDGKPAVAFCRDEPAQDVREIVLAYSNSSTLPGHKVSASTSLRSEDTCALHYKVLSASINNHTVASSPDTLCGQESGRRTFTASGGAQAFDPDNAIATHNGSVSGDISVRVPGGAWSGHHLEGCSLSPSPMHACTVDMPTRPVLGDGRWPMGFSISGGANDAMWQMRWSMDDPEVGFVDAGDDECNVHIWGYFDDATQLRMVPRATMLQTSPVTLVFKGSGVAPNTPNNPGATVSHTWNYTMTIQRVGPDGAPLS
jgi:hypothetical protein